VVAAEFAVALSAVDGGIFCRAMFSGLDLAPAVHFLFAGGHEGGAGPGPLESASATSAAALREQNIAYSGVNRDAALVTVKFRDAAPRSKGRSRTQAAFRRTWEFTEREEAGEFLLNARLQAG